MNRILKALRSTIPFLFAIGIAFISCTPTGERSGTIQKDQSVLEGNGIRLRASDQGKEYFEAVDVKIKNQWVPVLETHNSPIVLNCDTPSPKGAKPDFVVFDFEDGKKEWKVLKGDLSHAFTNSTSHPLGKVGNGFIRTCEGPNGYDDKLMGTLQSPFFLIDHDFITIRVGGGEYPEKCYVALVEKDSSREIFRITGHNSEVFRTESCEVKALKGKEAFILVVDQETGRKGHINLDHIVLTDIPVGNPLRIKLQPQTTSLHKDRFITHFTGDGWNVTRTITTTTEPGLLQVMVSASAPDITQKPISVEDKLSVALTPRPADHAEGPFDLFWAQSLKRAQKDFIPHWHFKAPAVIAQQGSAWVALIPNLLEVDKEKIRNSPPALDLEAVGPNGAWLSYGLIQSEPKYHSGFIRNSYEHIEQPNYTYWIFAGEAPRYEGFRPVTEFLWKKYGAEALTSSPDLQRNTVKKELCLFEDWRKEAWERYAREVYREFDLHGTPCSAFVSGLAQEMSGKTENAHFDSWFQSLKTAYGLYLYGKKTNDAMATSRAERILNLALQAPRKDGFFALIFKLNDKTWLNDGSGFAGGYPDCYHTFCMSWTGYWMLQWIDLVPNRKEEILKYCREYGDALLKYQRHDGFIPSWIRPDGSIQPEMGSFNAETAGSAFYLAELYDATKEQKYLDASKKAMEFIVREVFPRRRWYDFEVFISCSPKPYDFYDPITAQYPQNNLCTIQAAMAAEKLCDITGQSYYRGLALRLADDVALTQQVWNHPGFTPKLVGGMTTQNSDAEWSDARQCYATLMFLKAYDLSGKLEYLQRSVAAARASFAIAPWENWAHFGIGDNHGGLTSFHWGTGSAMASIEMMVDRLGDAYVNLNHKHGIGFNACTLDGLEITDRKISLNLKGVPEWKNRKAILKFEGCDPSKEYQLKINNEEIGKFKGERLTQGVAVKVRTD